MRSNKQTKALRTNGRKSSGPVTDAGKANSAANAITHNLSAASLILLSTEDQHEFHIHQAGHLNRFQPIDTVELDLVHKMICASWRERRVATMEAALFELQMERQRESVDDEFEAIAPAGRQVLALFGTTDASAVAGLLLRYGAAARRAYAAAFRILRELQGDRFNNIANQLPATRINYLPPKDDTATTPLAEAQQPPSNAPTHSEPAAAQSATPAAAAAKATANTNVLPRLRLVLPSTLCQQHNNYATQHAPSTQHYNNPQNTELRNEPEKNTAAATATNTISAIRAIAA